MAFGTVRTLRRRGLRVPEDISVIGFDDIAPGAHVHTHNLEFSHFARETPLLAEFDKLVARTR